MKKSKYYDGIRFRPAAIRETSQVFESIVDEEEREKLTSILEVEFGEEIWTHDSQAEFFADIRREDASFSYRRLASVYDLLVAFDFYLRRTRVSVRALSRSDIEKVFEVLEEYVPESRLPGPPPLETHPSANPVIFIGHGGNPLWRDLKDHLQDKHGLRVEAYEIGARAGHAIRDILEDMLTGSSIAFLVMTGEDETTEGALRARQNVVHEIGLFQGRLGFSRAIVLLEDGTSEFSNIHGIQQIRFSKGNIRETFGDVLATLNREFPERQ